MKVLFVSSGNSLSGISPIVKNQGDSLKENGIEIEYFTIIGKGVTGYLRNIIKLRRFLKGRSFDIVHAHYSLSGYVASLSGARPLVVSLMGSDVWKGMLGKGIMKLFNRFFWDMLIVKSESMKKKIDTKNSHVIPNGVNFDVFQPIDKENAKKKVGFNYNKHIIFVANPERREKNYQLAFKAFKLLNDPDVELNVVSGVGYKDIPYYYYAADVLLLNSLWEGSPNVVKEAMACNLPIVLTDVGDVKEVIGDTEGCHVTSFDPNDVDNQGI
jgi:glycosyltransferase involved in cell wall biosynthesis